MNVVVGDFCWRGSQGRDRTGTACGGKIGGWGESCTNRMQVACVCPGVWREASTRGSSRSASMAFPGVGKWETGMLRFFRGNRSERD